MRGLDFVACSAFSACFAFVSGFDFALSPAFRAFALEATALESRFFSPSLPSLPAVS